MRNTADEQIRADGERSVPGRSPEAFVLKNRLTSAMAGWLWGVFGLGAVAVPINLLVSEESVDAVLIPSGIAVFAYMIWGASRIELRIDAEGVWMRNIIRTYSASWEQIVDITATQSLLPDVTAVTFGLDERSRVKHLRIGISSQATWPGGRSEARRMCLELLHRHARDHGILFHLTLEANLFRRPVDAPWASTPEEAQRLAREQALSERDQAPVEAPPPSEAQAASRGGTDAATKPAFSLPRFIGACLLFGPIIAGSIVFGDSNPETLAVVAAISIAVTIIAVIYARRSATRGSS
jgi:hypothetical protein